MNWYDPKETPTQKAVHRAHVRGLVSGVVAISILSLGAPQYAYTVLGGTLLLLLAFVVTSGLE